MPIKKLVNKDFFKEWTPEMAYVLGFFFADGSYDVNPRGSEYFSFQITDKKLLFALRRALTSNHKIAFRFPRNKNENMQYRLQIGSKEMCVDLRALGVSQKKTQSMFYPNVPDICKRHFIRGYFDGDGNVWCGMIHTNRKTQSVSLLVAFTSCSKKFLSDLRIACLEFGMGEGSLFSCGNAFRLQYSAKDSIILYRILYQDTSELYLKRKKVVFEKFIKEKQLRS